MELWAAVDRGGQTNVFAKSPRIIDGVWDCDEVVIFCTDDDFSKLACRGVHPGEKRKLTKFDPINEIVEYEYTLEERHQRLVDSCLRYVDSRSTVMLGDFREFLIAEGYIN